MKSEPSPILRVNMPMSCQEPSRTTPLGAELFQPAPSLPCGVLIPCHVVERRPFGVCCGSPTCAVLHLLPDWSGRCGSLVMCAP